MERDRNKVCCTCKSFVCGECHYEPPAIPLVINTKLDIPEMSFDTEGKRHLVRFYGMPSLIVISNGGWPKVNNDWWCFKWCETGQ